MSTLNAEVEGKRRNTRLLVVASVFSAVAIGAFVAQWPWAGSLTVVLLLLLALVLRRAEFIVYLFLFSSIFFKYRLDLGFATLNPYRVMFLVSLVALPFIPMRRGALLNQKMMRTGLVVVFLAGLFISGWARSTGSFRATATVNTFLLLTWLVFLLFLTFFVDRPARFEKMLRTYLATSTALALYGLYEVVTWIATGRLPELPFARFAVESHAPSVQLGTLSFPRIESLFHDANLLAIYLVIGVLLTLHLLLRKQMVGSRRLFLTLLLLLHVSAIILTVSRSGILLLFFALSLLIPRMLGNRTVRVLVFVLLMSAVLTLLLALSFPGSIVIAGDYLDVYRSRFTLEDETKRIEYAKTGLNLFGESPFVGVGMGHPELLSISRADSADTTHSFYLTILTQYGITGFVLVLLLLWPLLREATRVTLQSHTSVLDRSLATATWVVLLFQVIYDNLLGELMLFPFALLYIWALNRQRFERYDLGIVDATQGSKHPYRGW